ncbi:MAG: aminotransferase class I/II-fold pyridoxal phosphate-dependent enzyme [Actinomycetota bacterium]
MAALGSALTERTRAVIVNSPNNPTGRIYPEATLMQLATVLDAASCINGRPIYLLSDEAYKRILFDGRRFPSPVDYYDNSLLLYTYGKTLLTPGQRLGYVALNPAMPEVSEVARALFVAQTLTGWAFPNALLQHALADIEPLSIDLGLLQRKRDGMVGELRQMGYEVNLPEGTFYLLVRSPLTDDIAFARALAGRGIYVLPGTSFDMPGYFRISLTASAQMIDRALPGFATTIGETGT